MTATSTWFWRTISMRAGCQSVLMISREFGGPIPDVVKQAIEEVTRKKHCCCFVRTNFETDVTRTGDRGGDTSNRESDGELLEAVVRSEHQDNGKSAQREIAG